MYLSLYRRYRPQTFDDVIGQDVAVEVVRRAIQNEAVGHAYLFSGPRGCGKTTVARLLAKAINCRNRFDDGAPCQICSSCRGIAEGTSLDVIEIDGASNNKVDEIRDLKTHVGLASFSSPYKIYIVDEVHMLSIGAFNALLKTLEEPPKAVVFILATTEPFKVPVTIRSRCQHVPFHAIDLSHIVGHLRTVAEREGVSVDDEALWEIGRQADGAHRDALALLEQAMAVRDEAVDLNVVQRLIGGGGRSELCRWIQLVSNGEDVQAFQELEGMFLRGASVERVLDGLYLVFRDMWVSRRWGDRGLEALRISPWEREFLQQESGRWDESLLREAMTLLTSLMPQSRRGLRQDVLTGILMTKLVPLGQGAEDVCSAGKQSLPVVDSDSHGLAEPVRTSEKSVEVVEQELPCEPISSISDDGDPLAPLWSRLGEIPHIVTALALSRISKDGENLSVRIPSDRGYCFELLSGDRNSYVLQSALADDCWSGGLRLFWRDQERSFPSLATPTSPELPVEASEETLLQEPQSFESDIAATEVKKLSPTKQPTQTSPDGLAEALRVIRSHTSGEILYLRRDEDMERKEEDVYDE
ncbi:MAG: hypothetical protein CSA35_07605 [Dethiosulfovibrio peptidovorans]|nr:MAG: hypothetical protein CSA35_07605 [Dethiosulfovibrio peptidovorans]